MLYSELVSTMTSQMKNRVASVDSFQGMVFLEELSWKWKEQNKALERICVILIYFIPIRRKTPVLNSASIYGVIISFAQIRSKQSSKTWSLNFFQIEREGEVDTGFMGNIINMLLNFCDLDIKETYLLNFRELGNDEVFEKPFLSYLAKFYIEESQKFLGWLRGVFEESWTFKWRD